MLKKTAKFKLLLLGFFFLPLLSQAQNLGQNNIDQVDHNFSSGLELQEVYRFGDFTIHDALKRLPGVQVARDGSINLQGTGYNEYQIYVDGQQLSNSGFGTRNFDLEGISVDLIESLKIKKVLTPDLNPEGLGGAIFLNTIKPQNEGRIVKAGLGGGALTNYLGRVTPATNAWVRYKEGFNEKINVSVTISYQEGIDAWEQLETEFSTFNFGSGLVDVLERVSPGVEVNERTRLGSSFSLNYTPDSETSFYVRGWLNNSNSITVNHTDSWIANGDWIRQDTTGETGEVGVFSHRARDVENNILQISFLGGGQKQLEQFLVNYSLGWSQNSSESSNYIFPFQFDELDYSIDISNRFRPEMEITTRGNQVLDNGEVDLRNMFGQNFERIIESHLNNKINASLSADYPVNKGLISIGINALLDFKEGDYDEDSFEYNRTLRMISFNTLREPNRNVDIFGSSYRLPWLLKTEDAILFLESQLPVFESDENESLYQSEIYNYDLTEQIYSAYAITDLKFGKLGIYAGLRAEYTSANYKGSEINFDENGELIELNRPSTDKNTFSLYPNMQLYLDLGEQTSLHAAYSKTISRPNYGFLVPFERVSFSDSTLFSGNPNLEPVISNNVELKLNKEFSESGMISIRAFYKNISDLIIRTNQSVTDGTYTGFESSSFINSTDKVDVYGVELTLNQRFTFLPGVFSNFGSYLNYTWSESLYTSSRGETDYPGLSPHVVNAALNFMYERFFAQATFHWTAEYLSKLADTQQFTPSALGVVYRDQYSDGYRDLSINLEYQLSERFKTWANIYNILSNDRIEYEYTESLYPVNQFYRGGLGLSLGIRYELR